MPRAAIRARALTRFASSSSMPCSAPRSTASVSSRVSRAPMPPAQVIVEPLDAAVGERHGDPPELLGQRHERVERGAVLRD